MKRLLLLVPVLLLLLLGAQHQNQTSLPYKSYVARLNQFGDTSDPQATVIYSNLGGNVAWSRDSAGQYRATSNLLVTGSNAVVFISGNTPTDTYAYFTESDGGAVIIRTIYDDLFVDGISNCNIEIRVY